MTTQHAPQIEYVANNREVIRKIVLYFAARGFCDKSHIDDFIQEITLDLLENWADYTSQYQGRSQFSSYFHGIVLNKCRNLARWNKYRTINTSPFEDPQSEDNRILSGLVLSDEFGRLDFFFTLHAEIAQKLILSLKVIFDIRISLYDLHLYQVPIPDHLCLPLLSYSATTPDEKNKMIVYALLHKLFSHFDDGASSQDSTRKWIDYWLNMMIRFMNGTNNQAAYNRKTVQYLLEIYFDKKKHNNSKLDSPFGKEAYTNLKTLGFFTE